tara:strand:- start:311 stop:583 length:273 start_codon:yes stop_codon:yes gene_type:complete
MNYNENEIVETIDETIERDQDAQFSREMEEANYYESQPTELPTRWTKSFFGSKSDLESYVSAFLDPDELQFNAPQEEAKGWSLEHEEIIY